MQCVACLLLPAWSLGAINEKKPPLFSPFTYLLFFLKVHCHERALYLKSTFAFPPAECVLRFAKHPKKSKGTFFFALFTFFFV